MSTSKGHWHGYAGAASPELRRFDQQLGFGEPDRHAPLRVKVMWVTPLGEDVASIA
jgi:hypothetical protein